jgi:hypothetical protein
MIVKNYIQFIKESIDYSELIQDIKDILLELEDDYFNINIIEHSHIIVVNIDNKIHSNVTEDDGEVYDYVRSGNKFISSGNIHIIEQCVDYLKDNLKPLGKNILDDLDVYFETSNNKSLSYSYPRFIYSVKNGMNVKNIKFSFIKNDN